MKKCHLAPHMNVISTTIMKFNITTSDAQFEIVGKQKSACIQNIKKIVELKSLTYYLYSFYFQK